MYIEPNTNIILLKNVPLDNTYEHTITFNSLSQQVEYFKNKTKKKIENNTYQRVNRGVCRVKALADEIYDCNYLMFQNNSFGNKWFYAFITSIEYVNNITSQISYEIDCFQTWMFDYEIEECFVEREHTLTDNIGEHIEPEGVECGEYVNNGYEVLTKALEPLAVVVMITDAEETAGGNLYGGVFGGATIYAYNRDDVESIVEKLQTYDQKPDAIVGMYMCPVIAFGGVIPKGGLQVDFNSSCAKLSIKKNAITSSDTIDGYKPKNKKLYTYPYNFYSVNNASGNCCEFRYEMFTSLQPQFVIDVPMVMPIEVLLRCVNYKNCGDIPYSPEGICLNSYPMCSWNTDAFKAWLAQNASIIGSRLVSGTLSAVTGNVIGAAVNAIVVQKKLSEAYPASIQADITRGNIYNGCVTVASNTHLFYGSRTSVNRHYAKMIDDFFNVYGYSVKVCKKPNTKSRPHWNYVKTVSATITGSIPADDANKICKTLDKGITFWHNGNEIGNYSLDNSPR